MTADRRISLTRGDIGAWKGEVEPGGSRPRCSAADTSNEGYMDIERPPNLRTPGTDPGSAAPPGGAGLGGAPPINALAELVADLIAATGLVPADKLALVRGAAGMGSLARALVDQNVASSEGLARTLAARHQMPLVDLALDRASPRRRPRRSPSMCSSALVAVPYALDDGTLQVAIADPGNIQGIDELRLATRYPLELGGRLPRRHRRGDPPPRPRFRGVRRARRRRGRARGARKRRTTPTTSRSTTASPTRRSSGSSTP